MDTENRVDQTSKGISCNACHRIFSREELLNFEVRKVDVEGMQDIIETGISCPDCKAFFHAEYTTKKLIGLYREFKREPIYVKKMAIRRDYDRRTQKLNIEVNMKLIQVRITEAFKNEATAQV